MEDEEQEENTDELVTENEVYTEEATLTEEDVKELNSEMPEKLDENEEENENIEIIQEGGL